MSEAQSLMRGMKFKSFSEVASFALQYIWNSKKELSIEGGKASTGDIPEFPFRYINYVCGCSGLPRLVSNPKSAKAAAKRDEERSKKVQCEFVLKFKLVKNDHYILTEKSVFVHKNLCDKRILNEDKLKEIEGRFDVHARKYNYDLDKSKLDRGSTHEESNGSITNDSQALDQDVEDSIAERPCITNLCSVEFSLEDETVESSRRSNERTTLGNEIDSAVHELSGVSPITNESSQLDQESNSFELPGRQFTSGDTRIASPPNEDETSKPLNEEEYVHQQSLLKDTIEENISEVKQSTLEKNDKLSCTLKSMSVSNNQDVADIVLDTTGMKTRGRPKETRKSAIGLNPTPRLIAYQKKNFKLKVKHALTLIIDKNSVENVLSLSYKVKLDDVSQIGLKNLSEFFMDSQVDINILTQYMDDEAFDFLGKLVSRKKRAKKHNCDGCTEEIKKEEPKIQCVACLLWHHNWCADYKPKKGAVKEWFCESCKTEASLK